MSDDKALTLAQQINDLYQKVVKTSVGALDHALDAGDLLIRAKETVKADKKSGKWTVWLKENCTKLPHSTANLYMHLAANREVIENSQRVSNSDAGAGKFSIRSALKLIPKTPKQIEKAEAAKANRAQKKADKEAASKSEQIERLLPGLAPDEVFIAVRRVWDKEQVEELVNKLGEYLSIVKKPKAEDPPAIPSAFDRRPPAI
jgi:hypothetical protein